MGERRAEVVVVGAGPAGMTAATRAAECGCRVLLIDDNPEVGGQIWRGDGRRVEHPSIAVARARRVVDAPDAGTLLVEGPEGCELVGYERLVLCTGARERFLPFPGWTLPNVTGAGGLQAMAKGGLPIADKRVVVAGSGPLLLAAAAYLHAHGAGVALIAEQTTWPRLAWFATHVARSAEKRRQALELRQALAGVPLLAGAWPVEAHGDERVTSVTLRTPRGRRTVACDYLACGFGLIPNVELARRLGCQTRAGAVVVDDLQETSVRGVFAAGEATGIGGLDLSLVEGEIAGYAAAGRGREARALRPRRARAQRFAAALERAFALRAELKMLPDAQTTICRCEDVRFEQLACQPSRRAAKLHTRCGMGACQGRICGGAADFLFGWGDERSRPPVFPTRIETLIASERGTS